MNDERKIRFFFEGATGWAEGYPPQPRGLRVFDDTAPQAVS